MRRLLRFLRDDTAATAVEYCVMLALIIIALIGAISVVGQGAGGYWGATNSKLQNSNFGQ